MSSARHAARLWLTTAWPRLEKAAGNGFVSHRSLRLCGAPCSFSTAAQATQEAAQQAPRFSLMSIVLFFPSAICGSLMYWQLERKQWKDDLIQRRKQGLLNEPKDVFTAESLEEYDKVKATGVLLHDKSLFVGPRPRSIPGQRMQSGYLLITPLYDAKRKGVVLVNRGWVPASWRVAMPAQPEGSKPLEVVGVIQPDEQPSQFISPNKPDEAEFHYLEGQDLAAALGLPEDTPLITAISNDPTTIVQRKKSPLEEARSEPMEAPTFPIAKNVGDLTRFATMPEDHLIYAGTWAALCVSLAAMATYAIRKPARTFKMVGEQTASKMYNK